MSSYLKSLFTENTLYYTVALIVVVILVGGFYLYNELSNMKRTIVHLKEGISQVKSTRSELIQLKDAFKKCYEQKIQPKPEPVVAPTPAPLVAPVIEKVPEVPKPEIMGTIIESVSDDEEEIEEIPIKKK